MGVLKIINLQHLFYMNKKRRKLARNQVGDRKVLLKLYECYTI